MKEFIVDERCYVSLQNEMQPKLMLWSFGVVIVYFKVCIEKLCQKISQIYNFV